MNPLPANICAHPDGLLVRVQRRGVILQAFVPKSHPDATAKAVALRDRFLRVAGPAAARKQKPRSNTGVSGVSETTMWRHNRPYPCFIVSWFRGGKSSTRRFLYRDESDRPVAFRNALARRAREAGEDPAALFKQASPLLGL